MDRGESAGAQVSSYWLRNFDCWSTASVEREDVYSSIHRSSRTAWLFDASMTMVSVDVDLALADHESSTAVLSDVDLHRRNWYNFRTFPMTTWTTNSSDLPFELISVSLVFVFETNSGLDESHQLNLACSLDSVVSVGIPSPLDPCNVDAH